MGAGLPAQPSLHPPLPPLSWLPVFAGTPGTQTLSQLQPKPGFPTPGCPHGATEMFKNTELLLCQPRVIEDKLQPFFFAQSSLTDVHKQLAQQLPLQGQTLTFPLWLFPDLGSFLILLVPPAGPAPAPNFGELMCTGWALQGWGKGKQDIIVPSLSHCTASLCGASARNPSLSQRSGFFH